MKYEYAVYALWVISFLAATFLQIVYIPLIVLIIAVYFADKVRREESRKGLILTVLSIVVLVVDLLFAMPFLLFLF